LSLQLSVCPLAPAVRRKQPGPALMAAVIGVKPVNQTNVMRRFQISLFVLAVLSFIAAAVCTGTLAGDALWRAGMALMLGDFVCMKLWPSPAPLR
jgi:hypothetical protein